MKHIKLLLIISILLIINACVNENKEAIIDNNEKNIIDIDTLKNKNNIDSTEVLQNSISFFNGDSLIETNHSRDSLNLLKKEKKEEDLEVMIDGKIYYKKDKDDYRLGKHFIFRSKKGDYNIKTGSYVPSGERTGDED